MAIKLMLIGLLQLISGNSYGLHTSVKRVCFNCKFKPESVNYSNRNKLRKVTNK